MNNNKLTLKIKFGSLTFFPKDNTNSYTDMYSPQQYIEYFLINTFDYKLLLDNNNEKTDIVIWDIQQDNENIMNDNVLNMVISVENLSKWNWYNSYNKFGNYGNKKMNIYLYNHIKLIEKTNDYIGIPLIYFRINYYLFNKDIIKPTEITNFNDKKFCLMINRSGLNNEIKNICNLISSIGDIDNIDIYTNSLINKSCYNSIELLNIFNKYKFIICFENSYTDGYITEKIFNCFFANTIGIYKGSPIVEKYLNTSSFIDARNLDNSINLIKKINSNEILYNNYISTDKISNMYNNENYQKVLEEFILSHKK
jgi:hypothetical protein